MRRRDGALALSPRHIYAAVGFTSVVASKSVNAELPVKMHLHNPILRRVPEAIEPAEAAPSKGAVEVWVEPSRDAAKREGTAAFELRDAPEGRIHFDSGRIVLLCVLLVVLLEARPVRGELAPCIGVRAGEREGYAHFHDAPGLREVRVTGRVAPRDLYGPT